MRLVTFIQMKSLNFNVNLRVILIALQQLLYRQRPRYRLQLLLPQQRLLAAMMNVKIIAFR